jgi:hypothetical protein
MARSPEDLQEPFVKKSWLKPYDNNSEADHW